MIKKPKVMIIIAGNRLGGPGKGLLQFIRNAEKDSFEYVLVNFIQKGQKTFEFMEVAKSKNVNFRLLKQKLWLDPTLFVQAIRIYREYECNIIQSHGYKGHIIAYVLSRFFGATWVGMVHGWTNENIKIRIYNLLEKWLLRFPDKVITVSPVLQDTVSILRKGKSTELILNAIDSSEIPFDETLPDLREYYNIGCDEIVIGVFGRFSPEKGHKIYIRALEQVVQLHPKIKTFFVGEGAEMQNLKDLAMKCGVKDKVMFCGHQMYVGNYYRAVDLVVLPSLSEGLPNVVLEAMAMEKAVLSTNVGGVSEIISHNDTGWLVEADNPISLAKMLISILDKKNLIEQIARNGNKSLYPKFSPVIRATKIIDVYNSMLGNKKYT